jgi:hypothetical protein
MQFPFHLHTNSIIIHNNKKYTFSKGAFGSE